MGKRRPRKDGANTPKELPTISKSCSSAVTTKETEEAGKALPMSELEKEQQLASVLDDIAEKQRAEELKNLWKKNQEQAAETKLKTKKDMIAAIKDQKRKGKLAKGAKGKKAAILDDLNEARISRGGFEWRLYAPGFKEALRGSFFKMLWKEGSDFPSYRIHQILDVEQDDNNIYDISVDGSKRWCGLFAKIKHRSKEYLVPFTVFSRGRFTEQEFTEWVNGVATEGGILPCRNEVHEKADDLDRYFLSELDQEDIDLMVKARRQAAEVAANDNQH